MTFAVIFLPEHTDVSSQIKMLRECDLLRVTTEIGYYVSRAWVTDGIRPGIVACSHHLGRWRLDTSQGTDR
jgi:anaerobic selenocysteine-containing dehydrogenase